jgi:hypothetical protein
MHFSLFGTSLLRLVCTREKEEEEEEFSLGYGLSSPFRDEHSFASKTHNEILGIQRAISN